jgi:hypothetical protein
MAMTLITLSASYGAGGSQVGPAVAQRFGVPFLDRAIPTGVAERLAVPLQEAIARDEAVGSSLARMTVWLGQVGQAFGAPGAMPEEIDDGAYCRATEQVIREHAAGEGAVILGRAAAVVLADEPGALHVRLDGPVEARIDQAMVLGGLQRADAERLRRDSDRAREAYVRHFYGVDARDPGLYHLMIDSTALALETVVEVIAAAAEG